MKTIAIYPGKGEPHFKEMNEPEIKNGHDIKAEVLKVGICGTDRGEVAGGRADPPEGENELIIGHEMFCRVIETGSKVSNIKPGDYGVFTVRRGCGECIPCSMNRSDMCLTGKYKERGIKQLHGYQAEYVVDTEQYFVKVADEIRDIAVLLEPASIVQKAISEALLIQKARVPGFYEQGGIRSAKVLVAGIGAVGLLAAFIISLQNVDLYGIDIADENSLRPQILKQIGGKYINGKTIKTLDIDDTFGEMDMIIEAAGVSELGFDLTDALGINGIYVMTGIPEGERKISVPGDSLMKQLVLKNQAIIGSVNASIKDFHSAADNLYRINSGWGSAIRKMFTGSYKYDNFTEAFNKTGSEHIKTVIVWKQE